MHETRKAAVSAARGGRRCPETGRRARGTLCKWTRGAGARSKRRRRGTEARARQRTALWAGQTVRQGRVRGEPERGKAGRGLRRALGPAAEDRL